MLTLKEKYINFFSNPPKSYRFVDTFCLHNCKNDKRISDYDRFGVKIPFVICKSCGLVRASKFLDPKSLVDFYQNNYTKIFSDNFMEPKEFYDFQSKNSSDLWNIIYLYKKEFLDDDIVLDLGGCAGGFLDVVKNKSKCYLVDYDEKYLEYARKKKISTIKGDINSLINENIKPDVIILGHVVEHIVDLVDFFQKLKIVMKENSIVYFEFPALDSLKLGRAGDLLNELHIPHIYYFTSYWMKDFLISNGFEALYVDKYSRIIAKLSSSIIPKLSPSKKIKKHKNIYIKTKFDIRNI